jgi:hypothetical protein
MTQLGKYIMDTKRLKTCSYLLPDPGGEVIRQCLEEIDRLREKIKMLEVINPKK